MNERRCLYCVNWRSDDENPEAAELEARFGPEVALVGDYRHPENRTAINNLWVCEFWEPKLREGSRSSD
jgi:hypothetical protein